VGRTPALRHLPAGTPKTAASPTSSRCPNRAAADLADRYAGTFTPETVAELLYDSHAPLARIHTHLPALAARFAADRLRAAARVTRSTGV
jgi:hypothetical protein